MIWHHNKFMELISASVTAGKNALNQDFRHLWYPEKFAPLPRGG